MGGPTVLGHGPDARAQGHETFADEVTRLAVGLPDGPLHLVGYSLGARLSLAIALRLPDRVSRLTLIGVNPGLQSEEAIADRNTWDAGWSQCLREKGVTTFVDRWQELSLWESQRQLPEAVWAAQRAQRLSHDAEQLARAMDALGTGSMPSMWKDLRRLKMSVQIVAGQLDSKYVEIGRDMCARMPNARLYEIPNAGHNPVLEQPQAVLDVINEKP